MYLPLLQDNTSACTLTSPCVHAGAAHAATVGSIVAIDSNTLSITLAAAYDGTSLAAADCVVGAITVSNGHSLGSVPSCGPLAVGDTTWRIGLGTSSTIAGGAPLGPPTRRTCFEGPYADARWSLEWPLQVNGRAAACLSVCKHAVSKYGRAASRLRAESYIVHVPVHVPACVRTVAMITWSVH